MKLVIEIPDNEINRVIEAFTATNLYQETIVDTDNIEVLTYKPNPQTKAQFTRDCVLKYIKHVVKQYETLQAKKAIQISEVEVI